jgi:hypothetical protein
MMGFTCGVWPTRRRGRGDGLVAVVVDEEGQAQPPLFVERSAEDACALLAQLDHSVGLDCELVLPDWLARSNNLARFALERGSAVWLVPAPITEAVRIVANLATGPPARTAAALARLPLAPALRGHLRRLTPLSKHQLPLL